MSLNYFFYFEVVPKINSGQRDNGFRVKDENNISIEEYKLENPHKSLTFGKKLIGITIYDFILIKKMEKVEVSKFIYNNAGRKTVLSHSLYHKQDNSNRNWEDVPVNNQFLLDIKGKFQK